MAGIDVTSVVVHSEQQVSCEVAGEAVVMSLARKEFYALNPTASAVWRLLETPRPVAAVVDQLVNDYGVAPDRCEHEVRSLLGRLHDRGVVDVVVDPST